MDLFREAWDRCRAMTKDQAMLAYIDEIRKVNEKKQKLMFDMKFLK
jgi:replication-associated recombination protein RarA